MACRRSAVRSRLAPPVFAASRLRLTNHPLRSVESASSVSRSGEDCPAKPAGRRRAKAEIKEPRRSGALMFSTNLLLRARRIRPRRRRRFGRGLRVRCRAGVVTAGGWFLTSAVRVRSGPADAKMMAAAAITTAPTASGMPHPGCCGPGFGESVQFWSLNVMAIPRVVVSRVGQRAEWLVVRRPC